MSYLNNESNYLIKQFIDNYSYIVYDNYNNRFNVWLLSAVGSLLVGVVSMLPLLLISQSKYQFVDTTSDKSGKNHVSLKYVLSFSVGALLGDVFFHLLPEAADQLMSTGMSVRHLQLYLGFWILTGILCLAFAQHVS